MEIKDLQVKQGNVELIADVIEVGQAREFTKFGRSGKVTTAILQDKTGQVKLSLWNEQVDIVKAGLKLKITNGYVNEFQGEKQLTTGKFGKLEVVGQNDISEGKDDGEDTKNIGSEEDIVY